MSAPDKIGMPVGWFRLNVRRHGVLVETIDEENATVIGYGDAAAAAYAGQSSGFVTKIGYGTSLAPAAWGNASLTGAFTKLLDGFALAGGGTGCVQFQFSLAPTEAVGLEIGEFGLLTSGGLLVARKVRLAGPIAKDTVTSFQGTWTVKFVGPA